MRAFLPKQLVNEPNTSLRWPSLRHAGRWLSGRAQRPLSAGDRTIGSRWTLFEVRPAFLRPCLNVISQDCLGASSAQGFLVTQVTLKGEGGTLTCAFI